MTRKSTFSSEYTNLDIYFHMANHYRKLRNVKCVIDTSPPKGCDNANRGRPQTRAQTVTPRSQKCQPKTCYQWMNLKIPDCYEKPYRSCSLPPRPPTRRSAYDTPDDVQVLSRLSAPGKRQSQTKVSKSERNPPEPEKSSTAKDRKDSPSREKCLTPVEKITPIPAPRKQKTQQKSASTSEHEYLQFSLRITEDIIRNDLYTNKEMRQVFNSHIEANRGRLDMRKMQEQVDRLSRELNIPPEDSDSENASRQDIKRARRTLQSSLVCICGPECQSSTCESRDCECGTSRRPPIECGRHKVKETTVPRLDIVTSLDRVTEVTEPGTSSRTTVKTDGEDDREGVVVVPFVQFAPKKKLEDSSVQVPASPVSPDKGKPSNDTCSEKATMVSSSNEYILVQGPIYIPKSLLQQSSEKSNAGNYNEPTYSMLHNKVDTVKHDVSETSTFLKDKCSVKGGQNIMTLESGMFKSPPKVLQVRDLQDSDRVSVGQSREFSDPSTILNEIDYDETPQRDLGYDALFKTAETTMSTDVIPTKQESKAASKVSSPVQLTELKTLKRTEEEPKQDLLLGDKYQMAPSEEPYDSCLPYPIYLFFPTVATQTASSDVLFDIKTPPPTPASIQSYKLSTKTEETLPEVSTEPGTQLSIVSTVQSASDSVKSPTVISNVKPVHDMEKNATIVSTVQSVSDSEKTATVSGTVHSTSDSENTVTGKFLEIAAIESQESLVNSDDFEVMKKSEPNDIDDVLMRLDKKLPLTHRDSHDKYVQQVVHDLEKFRQPENEPAHRRQSLKHMATVIENTAFASEPVIESLPLEAKPVLNLVQPISSGSELEPEETYFCGLKKKKRKKELPTRIPTEADVNILMENARAFQKSEEENEKRRSIRFEGPIVTSSIAAAVYDSLQSPFLHQMGSVTSDISTTTQISKVPAIADAVSETRSNREIN